MSDLERRYRRLFAAYPESHRQEREDEMVGVLLDVARPGQARPSLREAVSIVGNGVLERARTADDWRTGVRWAGVASLAMAVAMAGLAAGIGVLPPASGRITGPGYGPPVPAPAWLPVAYWLAGSVLAVVTAVAAGRRLRAASAIGVGAVAVVGLAAGYQVAGFLRWYTAPFAAFLVVSMASVTASRRTRLAAVAVGAALAVAHLLHFVDRFIDAGWDGREVRLWTVMSRWSLSHELTVLEPGHWWILVGASFLAVCWRPAVGVAVGLLAVPFAVLAAGPADALGPSPGGDLQVGAAVMAGLLLVAVGVERVRSRQADVDGHARRTRA